MKEVLYIYTRVSSANQVEKFSLLAQKTEGIKKASELRLDYEIFEEAGKSANKEDLENRPVMKKLYNLIEHGKVKHVFATEIDRLSRNEATQYLIKKVLADNQVTLYTTTKTYDFNDAEDEFFGSLLTLLARHENKLKSKRSIRGKIEAVKQGKHHGGMTAFGYTTDKDKNLIIDEQEAEIYKKIVKMSLDGVGVHTIAKKLNDEGIKPKLANFVRKELNKKHGVTGEIIKIPKAEMKWGGSSVLKILSNPLYKGERKFKDMIVPAPAIISPEHWKKIQDNLKANNTGSTRNSSVNKFLLHGLIICNKCGNSIWAKDFQSKYKKKDGTYSLYKNNLFYFCSSKQVPHLENCHLRSINKMKLENIVWENVTGILINSNEIKSRLKTLISSKTKDKELLIKDLRKYSKIVEDYDEQKDRLIVAYIKGIITDDELAQQKNRILSERDTYQFKVEEISQQITFINSNSKPDDYIKAVAKKVREIRNTTDFEFKKRFVRTWIKYIYIDYIDDIKEHVIEITLKYPLYFDKSDTITVLSNGIDIDDLYSPEEEYKSLYITDTSL